MKDNYQIALDEFRDYIISQSRSNLTRQRKNVDRKLYNSLKGSARQLPNSVEIFFSMEEYGEYQDKGVKGAMPSRVKNGEQKAPNSPFSFKANKKMIPTKVLDKWVVKKGIAPRDKDGKFINRNSLKFALAKRIHAQGIKPSLFFTKPFEKAFKKLPTELVQKYGLDLEKQFIDIIKQP